MLKAIKEIMIMLLVCLVGILLFAVIFYEFIPSRKEVAEVSAYNADSTVREQLVDNIDKLDGEVVLTFEQGEYQVTSTDLNRYKANNEYVPGKANPFAAASESVTGDINGKGSSSSGKSGSKSGKSSGNTSTNDEYIRNNGTK